ncbi:hypothetical protein GCM10009721_06270 [Terrabacter tumescens]|uniref:Uncharacterized protein n=1 Tax=Terrabacter tumescens TaxID=60443 RepID=A0ABQ2HK62_9MICO|nr:hypothetical protein [Terrabacter tumescens]GGM84265.1 hypothetical protein GCM10009721_06270 [Terrabacter tumescens]
MGDTMRNEKKNSKKKKSAAFVAAGVIGLATAGGAYAYWASLGGGTGTATTSTGASNVFAVTGNVANAMFPGDTAQTVTATVKNNGTENYKLQAVKAYVTTDKQGCDGSNYKINTVAAPTSASDAVAISVTQADLAPSGTTTGTFTMQFNNKDEDQNACKGAAVTLHYIAS